MDIILTGGNGFLGKYVLEELYKRGHKDVYVPRSAQYDLTTNHGIEQLFEIHKPKQVIHLAARVGGIGANMENPGKFFYDNMSMGLNLIENSRKFGIEKFVFVSTVCSYPKHCPVPFKEEDIWNGYPEETNAPYGIAKKAIGVMLEGYRKQYGLKGACLIPTNLYGPGDNFNPNSSHVIPALIKKFVDAKEQGLPNVSCWGTGSATREFLYAPDAAVAVVDAFERVDNPVPINLGSGDELSIRDLVQRICAIVGYDGEILWDASKPDGQPKRFLDTSRAREMLGWSAGTSFDEGIKKTYEWYVENRESL